MADQKTLPTPADVERFLDAVEPDTRRQEGRRLLEIFRAATGDAGTMWGPSIVGFGSYHYRYASGRTGTSLRVGFSPRKAKLTLYLPEGFDGYEAHLAALGPHSTGKSCLYVKRLDDLDEAALHRLIEASFAVRHPDSVDPDSI